MSKKNEPLTEHLSDAVAVCRKHIKEFIAWDEGSIPATEATLAQVMRSIASVVPAIKLPNDFTDLEAYFIRKRIQDALICTAKLCDEQVEDNVKQGELELDPPTEKQGELKLDTNTTTQTFDVDGSKLVEGV